MRAKNFTKKINLPSAKGTRQVSYFRFVFLTHLYLNYETV